MNIVKLLILKRVVRGSCLSLNIKFLGLLSLDTKFSDPLSHIFGFLSLDTKNIRLFLSLDTKILGRLSLDA